MGEYIFILVVHYKPRIPVVYWILIIQNISKYHVTKKNYNISSLFESMEEYIRITMFQVCLNPQIREYHEPNLTHPLNFRLVWRKFIGIPNKTCNIERKTWQYMNCDIKNHTYNTTRDFWYNYKSNIWYQYQPILKDSLQEFIFQLIRYFS